MIVSILAIHGAAAAPGPDADARGSKAVKQDKDKDKDKEAKAAILRREGETYAALGRIVLTGDRYMFYPSNDDPALRILENLGLERVARVLDVSRRDEPTWSVSGVIYEFRGSNYFLLERAVVKGRTRLGERKK